MASRVAFRTCPLCEATCGLRIELDDGRVTRIRGDLDDPISRGFLCPKGSTLGKLHEDPDRLRAPLVRRNGELVEVGWAEAFAEVDRRLRAVVSEHGSDSAAVYVGNPNAHNYQSNLALRPFIKSLRTRNVFSASTVDQMPKQVACGYVFGHPFLIPVPDVDRTDHLLILGANPLESNGSLATAPDWPGKLEALRARGGTLVVVDPRRTRTADLSDQHVAIRPGTDAALLAAMAQIILAEGLASPGPIAEHTTGLDELGAALRRFTPEAASAWTGVGAATIRRLARELAAAPTAVVYGRIGTHTTRFGTLAAWLVDVLNLLTGNLDRPGGAMFAHAAHEQPTRRRKGFVVGRWASRVSGHPEVMGELPAAALLEEIDTPGDGAVRALFTVGGNPAMTTPDAGRLGAALDTLDLMVSVDPYLNATTRHADVILPPPSALERGHYDFAFQTLSLRDFADWSPAVFDTDAPSEFEILVRLTAIAAGLGPDVDPDRLAEASLGAQVAAATTDPDSPLHGRDPEDVMAMLGDRPMDERILDFMIRAGHRGDWFGRRPEGLSLAVLEANPHGMDFGPLQPRLPGALATVSGTVEIAPEPLVSDLDRLHQAMTDGAADGMVLVGRRQVRTANSWTHNVEVLVKGKEACTMHVHPADAARLDLADGSPAVVTSKTGSVEVPVEITDTVMPGVVSIPYGWGHPADGTRLGVATRRPGTNVNILTPPEIDPLSGNAVLNGIAVTVAPGSPG